MSVRIYLSSYIFMYVHMKDREMHILTDIKVFPKPILKYIKFLIFKLFSAFLYCGKIYITKSTILTNFWVCSSVELKHTHIHIGVCATTTTIYLQNVFYLLKLRFHIHQIITPHFSLSLPFVELHSTVSWVWLNQVPYKIGIV